MSQKNTDKDRASQANSATGSLFDPHVERRAKSTMNFIGMCLHTPMTPEAKRTIMNHILDQYEQIEANNYITGYRDGYDEAKEEMELEIARKGVTRL